MTYIEEFTSLEKVSPRSKWLEEDSKYSNSVIGKGVSVQDKKATKKISEKPDSFAPNTSKEIQVIDIDLNSSTGMLKGVEKTSKTGAADIRINLTHSDSNGTQHTDKMVGVEDFWTKRERAERSRKGPLEECYNSWCERFSSGEAYKAVPALVR